jgi:hypothetical protein
LDTVNPQQGKVFLAVQNAQFKPQIGVVNQTGETKLSYTIMASAGEEIFSYLKTDSGSFYISERIKLGDTNPILHIKATH